jgi:UDP-2,3-diacylglucosamine pyrophosphatase LpxH
MMSILGAFAGPGKEEEGEISYIVSDLHLGLAYFHRESFLAWLDQLPPGGRLILNGDIVDEPGAPLPAAHQAVLDRLVRESHRRPLVWVRGNHDVGWAMEDAGRIQFVDHWAIDRRLLVVHGSDLDDLMPRHGLFKWLFKRFHRLRVALGWPDVHVAQYAKKWDFLYRTLNKRVARNALRVARRRGFAAITCGHTHAAMDLAVDGRRYLNTGAWTEAPLHYLVVDPEQIRLQVYEDGRGR